MQDQASGGHKAMLALVIGMGVLILAGTATLIGVVVHRLANGHRTAPATEAAESPVPGAPTGDIILSEPAGTRILSLSRQSDTVLALALTGGGPDRVLVWDLGGNRRLAELRLGPTSTPQP